MAQLLALDQCCNLIDGRPCLPPSLNNIVTPVHHTFWATELARHQDQSFAQYILQGLSTGFRIGFSQPTNGLQAAKGNMISASEHPLAVSEYITKELELNHLVVAGPAESHGQLRIHVSPLGVIPKKHKENQ